MKLVLDTSVLVAGFRSRQGASNRLLRAVARGEVQPLVTTALFLEYESVLLRPEHRIVTGLGPTEIERILASLASACEPVEVHFRWRPQLRDAADELVLEAAVNGQADALVTHNVRDFVAAAGRFGLRVLTPQASLKELVK
ncbi:MAG: putative toxin-antitoxin system toxin component, PIN family [Woeseiaceae bacterium]